LGTRGVHLFAGELPDEPVFGSLHLGPPHLRGAGFGGVQLFIAEKPFPHLRRMSEPPACTSFFTTVSWICCSRSKKKEAQPMRFLL
jgi:hypothetical protein